MNIETRKLDIIKWVTGLKDESILSRIEQLRPQNEDWWELTTLEEKIEIEEGLAQADRGDVKSTEDVLSKYEKWDTE